VSVQPHLQSSGSGAGVPGDVRARSRGRRDRPRSGWASLTPTEREVATLTAAGLTNRDIGAQLRQMFRRAAIPNVPGMDARHLIDKTADAWNSRDRAGFVACYAEDCEITAPGFAGTGHQAVTEFWDA